MGIPCFNYDIAIIGAGPAGLAAALSAKKTNPKLSVLLLERDKTTGGILNQCIHNGFGLHYFGKELTGPEYAARFKAMLDNEDCDIWLNTMVISLNKNKEITCLSKDRGYVKVTAKAIILAMGCRERTRGALAIPGSRPAGIFTAGCAQRLVNTEALMPGKEVVILGSGDIGLIMARRMTWEGAKVKLVCELMPYSSGLNRNIVQCLNDNDIPLKFNHTITQIHGHDRVEAVTVSEVDPKTKLPINGTEEIISCDTLLLSVGLLPENELTTQAGIELSTVTNGATVDEMRQTEVSGIFACGNVLHVHDLVDNVSNEATLAGKSAAMYVDAPVSGKKYNVVPKGFARYTVPQKISEGFTGKLDIYFRVSDAIKPARAAVLLNGQEITSRKKQIMTPGEMEKITVEVNNVSSDIELNVEAL